MDLGDLIADAYVKNGIQAPGEATVAERADYALREANRMIGQWNIQNLLIFTTDIRVFPLTARTLPTYWYTIGPTGDFVTARPNIIKKANLVLTTSSPTTRVPIDIYDDLQWGDIPTPALGAGAYPTALYNDGDYPNSKLYLNPYPTITQNSLELYVERVTSAFTAITDSFQMPDGYEDAFMLTLSERLCEGVREIPATLKNAAAMARAAVKSVNSKSPKMSTSDSGMPHSGGANNGTFWDGWPAR